MAKRKKKRSAIKAKKRKQLEKRLDNEMKIEDMKHIKIRNAN